MFWSYYGHAFTRSWYSAWDWATGQGIYLTWLFALGVVIAAAIYAAVRAWRKHHSWSQAVSDVRKALGDFVMAAFGGTVVVLVLLFVVFFIRDAHTNG